MRPNININGESFEMTEEQYREYLKMAEKAATTPSPDSARITELEEQLATMEEQLAAMKILLGKDNK